MELCVQSGVQTTCLCVSGLQDPVCTPSGYIYSRDAIIENLGAQKKNIKRKLAAWEQQQEDDRRQVTCLLLTADSHCSILEGLQLSDMHAVACQIELPAAAGTPARLQLSHDPWCPHSRSPAIMSKLGLRAGGRAAGCC